MQGRLPPIICPAIVRALVSFNVIMGTSQERKALASVEGSAAAATEAAIISS